MTVSFLVRLVPRALAESRIVGQVKAIETGVAAPVRSADDLIAFLLAAGPAEPAPARQNGHPVDDGPAGGDTAPE